MERDISVRPTEMTRPVKVDHLQSWSRIFRSDQTEMVRSIWCSNRNYRNFGLNGKRPRRAARKNLGPFNVRKDFRVHGDKMANRPTADPRVIGVSPITIPETIAGHISAPVPFSFLWWRMLIRHLHISHNAPYLPPKILHKYCFEFLLGRLRNKKQYFMQKFFFLGGGGAKKVHYGRWDLQVAYAADGTKGKLFHTRKETDRFTNSI